MTGAISPKTTVVVATTVMLSFISFWRAAAIVLSDLASSAYYAGGIAETAIGKSAPWFILASMLFGFAIRAIYIESCSMFVRGGVYKVVHEALGGTLAKISVSALMFDYVLTGPISGVSAGLYLAGLINNVADYLHQPWHVPAPYFAAGFALITSLYFRWQNTIGMHESSDKALRIMQITTVMVVILIGWCALTVYARGFQPVPLPTKKVIHFGPDALGWLQGTMAPGLTLVAILIGLGHSLLAMSGFETLAQVYREIEAPKLKNLKRTGLAVIVYSLFFTSLVSFFAVMLIPDPERAKYLDNLIGGLSMFLIGPTALKLMFHVFVVLVGTLILSGAVNTAIIGSNGVLNRVAEDGVLPDWFRRPHPKFGTTSRLINLVVILQIITILVSRGDMNMLGEAYAFGVIWSFAMKALAVLVLRYKRPEAREWKVPLNLRIGKTEIPLGLILITTTLVALAMINVATKKTATISGSIFTVVFFLAFFLSERHNRQKQQRAAEEREKFQLDEQEDLSHEAVRVRPGNVLVEVTRQDHLEHLVRVLQNTNTEKQDIIAVAVHGVAPLASGEHALRTEQIFSTCETELFSKVVNIAEEAGKHVELLVVPGKNASWALVQVAQQLQSSRVVTSESAQVSRAEQARQFGRAWEQLPEPRPSLNVEVASQRGDSQLFALGPHPPQLWPSDIDRVHRLWQELSDKYGFGSELHHRDVVSAAPRRFDEELHSDEKAEILRAVRDELRQESTEVGRTGPRVDAVSGGIPDPAAHDSPRL